MMRALLRRQTSLIVVCLAVLFNGCEQRPQVYQQQILAMGTLVDISLYGVEQQQAQDAILAISRDLETVHHDYHPWLPGKLTDINQAISNGVAIPLDSATEILLNKGSDLSQRSHGLFNPAIGKLISLWGFHSDERPDAPPPADEQVKHLITKQPSMENLAITNGQLSSSNPVVQLDLGAFAKGYAVDLAIAELKQRGIDNAIINAGGDLRAIGSKGGQPWRIGIRHPRKPGVIASLETHGDESVFTSGDYERYFDYDGHHYHHIIDPRSGYPAQGVTSVTVIHQDATTADAAATALFIAGPDQWQGIAKSLGLKYVMLIDSNGVIHETPAMAERIHIEVQPKPEIIIFQP